MSNQLHHHATLHHHASQVTADIFVEELFVAKNEECEFCSKIHDLQTLILTNPIVAWTAPSA